MWTAGRGLVPLKEIEPGDHVFAFDETTGRFVVAPVRAAAQTGTKQTYAVQVGVRTIRATDNHPFLVSEQGLGGDRAQSRRTWKTVAQLRPGDLVAVPRRLPDFGISRSLRTTGDFGPRVSTPELMWLLGYFVGAGVPQAALPGNPVQVTVRAVDTVARDEIARVVREQFDLSVSQDDDQALVIDSPVLVDWLWDNGFALSSPAAAGAHVAGWVDGLPAAERLAFLGGWGEAVREAGPDGWRASEPTAAELGLGLGEILGLAELSGLSEAGQTVADEDLAFATVTSVTAYEVEPVWDLEVDGPHNFVAEGLLVHNSEVVYHQIREDLQEKGVVFLDTDSGLREHEDLFREYFTTVIPAGDNKFASLNTAVWSGGSFIYVPPGVHVDIPLQAYFRINTENMGQFERTLIIADEGSSVHYVEGCTAPIYTSDSLHSAVVEIVVKPGARVRYTTIQNWSTNVYNLVTKRATCGAGATMEWVDGNIGSKVTMKYPAVYLLGRHAKGETLSIAFAGEGQHQDAGAKMVHAAPDTSSSIVSKSVARGGGRTSYRGLVQILEGATRSRSTVRCDALLVDTVSRSDTYPYVDVREDDVHMGHEATVSKVSEDQLFYLMSRGMTEEEAMAMIVRGFVEPIARELPMEYALELNRLIELQMEGAVG
ncbi:MAG: Fe-S cluster assembly protein SufB [Dermatophilaceae bacterium]